MLGLKLCHRLIYQITSNQVQLQTSLRLQNMYFYVVNYLSNQRSSSLVSNAPNCLPFGPSYKELWSFQGGRSKIANYRDQRFQSCKNALIVPRVNCCDRVQYVGFKAQGQALTMATGWLHGWPLIFLRLRRETKGICFDHVFEGSLPSLYLQLLPRLR